MTWARTRWLLWKFFHIWATCLHYAALLAAKSCLLPRHALQQAACPGQRCAPRQCPMQAAGRGRRRRDFNGEIWRQGEAAIGQTLSCFWGQEGHDSDRLLLCVIVLEFLCQGSSWSAVRTCWVQHNADLCADHTSHNWSTSLSVCCL